MKKYFTKNGIELTVIKPMYEAELIEHTKQQDIKFIQKYFSRPFDFNNPQNEYLSETYDQFIKRIKVTKENGGN
jgi:hypothetical protein